MDRVNIAVIGTGKMGQFHLNVINQIKTISLAGIYDVNTETAKTAAQKYETVVFNSMEEAIQKSDAVIIASPTIHHFDIASFAIKNNKHVLVEKPMTETYQQAKKIAELLQKHKVIFQVGHVERFNGAVQELKNIVECPILIEARRLSPFTERINDVGVVFDIMIHDIDIVLSFVSRPILRHFAVGKRIRTKNEDVASALLEFEGGTVATISASRITEEKIRTLAISSKEAYFILDYATQDITIHRQAISQSNVKHLVGINYKQESTIERVFIHRDNPLKLEDTHFANCILGVENPLVTIESDIQTLKITEDILNQIKETWK